MPASSADLGAEPQSGRSLYFGTKWNILNEGTFYFYNRISILSIDNELKKTWLRIHSTTKRNGNLDMIRTSPGLLLADSKAY